MIGFEKNRTAQIAIFVIVAIMILFLIIFLINVNFDSKREEVIGGGGLAKKSFESDLFPLKDNVQRCVEREMKKGLIVAGLRGGFIYDYNPEMYFDFYLNGAYSDELISNLGLNSNYFKSVLIYSNDYLYNPLPLDVKKTRVVQNAAGEDVEIDVFGESVKEEFERFVFDNFLSCISFDRYIERGYDVSFDEYLSFIDVVSGDRVIFTKQRIGDVGDKVSFSVDNVRYYGQIVENDEFNRSKVSFSEPVITLVSNSGVDFYSIPVVNLNSSVGVNISFGQDDVYLRLNFPFKVVRSDFSSSFRDLETVLEVRFLRLVRAAECFSRTAFWQRSLTLDELNERVNDDGVCGKYLDENINVSKTYLVDLPDRKSVVYTFEDKLSKLFGYDFVFNFGYDNEIAQIDLNGNLPEFLAENNVLGLLDVDSELNLNLKDFTKIREFDEKYVLRYKPFNSITPNYEIEVLEDGSVYFKGLKEGYYNFDFEVLDGEVSKDYVFSFIVGDRLNEDNVMAKSCFKFINQEKSFFPIADRFKNVLFNFTNGGGRDEVFGYYLSDSANNRFTLGFRRSCFFDYDNLFSLRARYSIDGGVSWKSLSYDESSSMLSGFENNLPYRTIVEVSVVNTNSGDVFGEPFVVNLFSVDCLGPDNVDVGSEVIESCCDLSVLPEDAFIDESEVNNLKSGDVIFDKTMLFSLFSGEDDFSQFNMWDYNPEISSVLRADVKVVCGGNMPSFIQNVVSIEGTGGGVVSGVTDGVFLGNDVDDSLNIDFKLDLVEHAGVCEFSSLLYPVKFGFYFKPISSLPNKPEYLFYEAGFISSNGWPSASISSSYAIGPIPRDKVDSHTGSVISFKNYKFLCSEDKVASVDGFNWNDLVNVGEGGAKSKVYMSPKYCRAGSSSCDSGRSDVADARYDNSIVNGVGTCQDWYFDSSLNALVSKPAPSSWQCGTKLVCDRSLCASGGGAVLKSTTAYCAGISESCDNVDDVNCVC